MPIVPRAIRYAAPARAYHSCRYSPNKNLPHFLNRYRIATIAAFAAALSLPMGSAFAQVGTCTPALGEAYLDVNNVRARIFNNGNLFWRGSPHVYEVPKGGGASAIFTTGIWIGGYVGEELRVSMGRYDNNHFWPGPLDEAGTPPVDCSVFDRLYKISLTDIREYEATGVTTEDLRDWPTGLGAPTYAPPGNGEDDDRDGTIDEEGERLSPLDLPLWERVDRVIDLEGGERPAIVGDQAVWWIMNDRGNEHTRPETLPVGLEVHATAYAFNVAGDIGNATFYRYDFFYRGSTPLRDAYMAIYADPDLGNYQDDWIASDTTLGMGIVWNSDNKDEGPDGYGAPAPALGYDIVQGPIVPSPGDTANVGGTRVPGFRNLRMGSFATYRSLPAYPRTALDHYYYMQGRWNDGHCITDGGNGRDFSDECTSFFFPGDMGYSDDECQYWSECNSDGDGTNIEASDRHFIMGTGPFTMDPGDSQQLVFGIVWARGRDNFDSAQKVKQAGRLAQTLHDANYEMPSPPSVLNVTATPMDRQVILEWSNDPASNNFLEGYRVTNPFAPFDNNEYAFEGYEVIQYEDELDQVGRTIAVYDVANGVQRVVDTPPGQLRQVTATGMDRGVQTHHTVSGLTNYKTYHFGVRAYAYNDASTPKVLRSPVTRIEILPTRPMSVISDLALTSLRDNTAPDFAFERHGIGDGVVTAKIVNPATLHDATYSVEFYAIEGIGRAWAPEGRDVRDPRIKPMHAKQRRAEGITFDIIRDGEVVFDGTASGRPVPLRPDVARVDGLTFSVRDVEPGFRGFLVTANASGALDPPESAVLGGLGFPDPEDLGGGTIGRQQATASVRWSINAGGSDSGVYGSIDGTDSFLGRVLRLGDNLNALGVKDYEIRFSQRCANGMNGTLQPTDCFALRPFGQPGPRVIEVPFELWDAGIKTPNDPSDDVRLVPAICDTALCGGGRMDGAFDIGGDHPASDGADDPLSDWVYFYRTEDISPGESGYAAYWNDGGSLEEALARIVLVLEDGGTEPPYVQAWPEVGTIIRIETAKPIQPGDVFTASTVGYGVQAPDLATSRQRLQDIGIVPNPYAGASSYEVKKFADEVRFTNLPDVAIIRVFTLNGTLIKTIRKNSPGLATISWDLTTDRNLPIGSGLYLIHVEVPGVGETALKFAAVKKHVQLDVY